MKKPVYLENSLTSNYSVTDAWADIDLQIKIPESGYYLVFSNLNTQTIDTDAGDATLNVRIAYQDPDGVELLEMQGTAFTARHSDEANTTAMIVASTIMKFIYLKKDTVLSVQAKNDTGDNCFIQGTSKGVYTSRLSALKLAG